MHCTWRVRWAAQGSCGNHPGAQMRGCGLNNIVATAWLRDYALRHACLPGRHLLTNEVWGGVDEEPSIFIEQGSHRSLRSGVCQSGVSPANGTHGSRVSGLERRNTDSACASHSGRFSSRSSTGWHFGAGCHACSVKKSADRSPIGHAHPARVAQCNLNAERARRRPRLFRDAFPHHDRRARSNSRRLVYQR